jgi:hypothetical protein
MLSVWGLGKPLSCILFIERSIKKQNKLVEQGREGKQKMVPDSAMMDTKTTSP